MIDEPQVREMRYSASHRGWFWRVTAPDPTSDGDLWASGFASRKGQAERAVERAKRRMAKEHPASAQGDGPMSVGRAYWLMCDYPDCQEESFTDTYLADVRKQARKDGWFTSSGRDLCPDHRPDQ